MATPAPVKPDHGAGYARWLAARNTWGVISTISVHLDGSPFGNIASYSDGLPGQGKGIPYFYLSMLDYTPQDAAKDNRVSFTLSEAELGPGQWDPEDPRCARLTLSGKLVQVAKESDEGKVAWAYLLAKHPQMQYWPGGHQFEIFKLVIGNIFLLDKVGGPEKVSVEEYLNYKPLP